MQTPQRVVTGPAQQPPLARGLRWSGRTRGGYFGNWFFIQLVRWLGVWPAYFWLIFVAAYFTVANAVAYRATVEYWEHLLGPLPWWRRRLLVYRHFLAHGVTLVDRLAVLMGRSRIGCIFDGEELFKPYFERRQGIILLGSHIGCWELGGHFLGRFDIPVNLVVIEREAAGIQKLLDTATGQKRFRLLTADDNPLRAVPILSALRRGEIVALLGDRSIGSADTEAEFLGGEVRLPVGPYHLAAASGAPIFHVFVVREKLGHYRFVTFPPESVRREELILGSDAVETRVRRYAERLETFVRQYPFQWANFFPYWEHAPKSSPASAVTNNTGN